MSSRIVGTTAVLQVLAYVIVASGATMWAPEARASQGQCKWEGGPGFPTYPSCKLEDCIEDGGKAVCTEPEIRPQYGRSDAQVDAHKFGYSMCEIAVPSVPRSAKWCVAQGGTWNGTSAPVSCSGLTSQYPGIAKATNEGAAIAASEQFVALTDPSCSWAVAGDSGWGLVDTTDQFCHQGAPIYKNGQLLEDQRRRDYTLCGTPTLSHKIVKRRQLICPNHRAVRVKPNGDLQCFLPPCCLKIGNPVDAVTGAKTEQEVDYRAADGLEFARYYNSQGRFRPRGSGPFISNADDYWRFSYMRRIVPISGNSYAMAALQREDGSVVFFNTSGQEILNLNGGGAQLQSLGSSGWQLTTARSDVEHYDSAGRLTSVLTSTGLTTTVTYGTNGRIDFISNTFGRSISLGYNLAGQLTSVTLPDSNQITYGYDSRGRLSTVTYADSSVKTYLYEQQYNEWLLTGIVDENNSRYATYTYTDEGLMQSEEHAGGVNRYTFNVGNPILSEVSTGVTDPLGQSRQYVVKNTEGVFRLRIATPYCPSCPNVSQASFDANGNYSSKADLNGRTTTYTHDLTRNLEISRTEASGTPNARTITTTWHPVFRLPATITEPNRITSYTYDSITSSLLTRTVTDTSVTPNVSRTWTYTYDTYGRLLTEDGPRTDVADVTTYTYYTCFIGNECGQVHTVTNALGQVTTYDTYNAHGQPLTVTDANGVVTTLTYDLRQRLTSRTIAGETTTFEYWPTGLLKKVTQPDASFLLYTYDPAHRLTEISDALENRIAYTLDGAGNRQVDNRYDPLGALVRTQTQLYNKVGQLWQVLTASSSASQATVYSYDTAGNQTRIDAPLGRATTHVYDELMRLKQTVDPALGTTNFSYNSNDNLTQVVDPKGLITSYTYTGFGELKTLTSPDTGLTTNTYGSDGSLATSNDARGAKRTYTYDALGRVTSEAYGFGSTTDQTITYGYDAGAYGKGKLTSAGDANHSLTWTYDSLGRVTTKTQAVGGVLRPVTYGYSNGRLASIALPSGQVVNYGYDTSGQLVSITLGGTPSTTILSDIVYDPFGPIGGWTWGNATLAVRIRDLDGRITQIDSAGMSSYTYFDDGSISSRLDDTPSTYTLPTGLTNVAVSSTSNRVSGTTGVLPRTYAHDPAGNVTTMGDVTFTYSSANRMSSASKGGVTTFYTYNALGQRIRKSSAAGTTIFVYDEAGHLLGEYDGTGALIQETVWLGDIPVATLRPTGTGTIEVYYIHTDHLDTPRRISRPSDNAIVWRWDSDPFGAALPNQDPDADASPFVFSLRFPGQYTDSETALSYNYFRDYDPATGRYIESDPIGLEGGVNTYAYAGSSPVHLVDPSGLKVVIIGHLAGDPAGRATSPNSYHLSLYLDPDDRCVCEGQWPVTLGGQPYRGALISRPNYPGDALSHATFRQVVPTPGGLTDCEFIRRLIAAAAAYNNKTPYAFPNLGLIPGRRDGQMAPGTYNSNSYVAGVLAAAGASPPNLRLPGDVQTPGYENRLPIPPRFPVPPAISPFIAR